MEAFILKTNLLTLFAALVCIDNLFLYKEFVHRPAHFPTMTNSGQELPFLHSMPIMQTL